MPEPALVAIEASPLRLAFKQTFSHASASRREGESVWVRVRTRAGNHGRGEGCPRDYVTGETLAGALAWIDGRRADWQRELQDLAALRAWVDANRSEIDANAAAWCAVELAVLDALARDAGQSVEALLGLPALSGSFLYTAVLGDSAAERFEAELSTYRRFGFGAFKIKLSGVPDRDQAKVAILRRAGIAPEAVRADANNLWLDAGSALAALAQLEYPFWAIEEPLRAGDAAGLVRVAQARGCAIVLDESLLRGEDLARLQGASQDWIANLRVSKMGGLLRSLALVTRLREAGIRVVVGAHVGESSLLTRAALTVAQAARDLLVGQEGAFGTHLLERDVVLAPLQFGAGGVLAAPAHAAAGFGFGVDA